MLQLRGWRPVRFQHVALARDFVKPDGPKLQHVQQLRGWRAAPAGLSAESFATPVTPASSCATLDWAAGRSLPQRGHSWAPP
eukprot:1871037-Pyramimonas_sp.AAC.1